VIRAKVFEVGFSGDIFNEHF